MARVRSDLQSPICHLNHPLLQANDNKGDYLPELHQYLAAGTPWLAGGDGVGQAWGESGKERGILEELLWNP